MKGNGVDCSDWDISGVGSDSCVYYENQEFLELLQQEGFSPRPKTFTCHWKPAHHGFEKTLSHSPGGKSICGVALLTSNG